MDVSLIEIAHCSGYYTPDGQWTNGFSCGAKQFCCVQVSEKLCCNLAERDSCCSGRQNAARLQSSASTRRLAVSTSRLTNTSQEAKSYAIQRDYLLPSTSTKPTYNEPQKLYNATARPLTWTTPVFPEFVVIGLAVGSILLVLLCSILITVYSAWRKRKLEVVNSSGAFRRSHAEANATSARINASGIPLTSTRQSCLQQAQQSAGECYVMGILPPPENFRTIDTTNHSWNPEACTNRQLVDEALAKRIQEETDATEYANISSIGPTNPSTLNLHRVADRFAGTNAFESDNLTEVSSITFNSDVIVWVPPAKKLRKLETCII